MKTRFENGSAHIKWKRQKNKVHVLITSSLFKYYCWSWCIENWNEMKRAKQHTCFALVQNSLALMPNFARTYKSHHIIIIICYYLQQQQHHHQNKRKKMHYIVLFFLQYLFVTPAWLWSTYVCVYMCLCVQVNMNNSLFYLIFLALAKIQWNSHTLNGY